MTTPDPSTSLAPAGDAAALVPASSASPLVPRTLAEASALAEILAKGSLLPDHFKGNVANVFWAIAQGLELNLPPVAALSGIYTVHGKPGMYASLKVALVLRSGLAHYFTCIEADDRHAIYETHRKGAPAPRRLEVTIEQATAAGWTKQNPKYQSEPRTMLSARCRSALAEDVFPDVLRGIPSVEELWDEHGSAAPAPASSFRAPASVAANAIDAASTEAPPPAATATGTGVDVDAVIADIGKVERLEDLDGVAARAKGVAGADRKRVLAAYERRLKELTAAAKAAATTEGV